MMQQTEGNNRQVDQQNRGLWRVFLAGPVVYSIYFVVVWVLSEFGCIAGIGRFELLGWNSIRLGVVVFTLIAALIIGGVNLSSFHRWRRVADDLQDPEEDDPLFMLSVGTWLNGFFVVITLLSAVPVLLRSGCNWL